MPSTWEFLLVGVALALLVIWMGRNQAQAPRPFSEIQSQPVSVEGLVKAGKKLQAIKLLCEQSGMSLKEAKEQVEAMGAGGQPSLSAEGRQADVDALIRNGNLIQAIKAVRAQSGLGLKEAKEWVEARAAELKANGS